MISRNHISGAATKYGLLAIAISVDSIMEMNQTFVNAPGQMVIAI